VLAVGCGGSSDVQTAASVGKRQTKLAQRADPAIAGSTSKGIVLFGGGTTFQATTSRTDGVVVAEDSSTTNIAPAPVEGQLVVYDALVQADQLYAVGATCVGAGYDEAVDGYRCDRVEIVSVVYDMAHGRWTKLSGPLPTVDSPDPGSFFFPTIQFIQGSDGPPTVFVANIRGADATVTSVLLRFDGKQWQSAPTPPASVGWVCRSGETLYASSLSAPEPGKLPVGLSPPRDVQVWKLPAGSAAWMQVAAPALRRDTAVEDPQLGCSDAGAVLVKATTSGNDIEFVPVNPGEAVTTVDATTGSVNWVTSSPQAVAVATSTGQVAALLNTPTGRGRHLAPLSNHPVRFVQDAGVLSVASISGTGTTDSTLSVVPLPES
jgi:hypothetical protein